MAQQPPLACMSIQRHLQAPCTPRWDLAGNCSGWLIGSTSYVPTGKFVLAVLAVTALSPLPVPCLAGDVQAGATFAASDRFTVSIQGVGGHAGMPHKTRDAVLAASMAVVALQPLLSREVNPVEGGVVTVSRFNTGGAICKSPFSLQQRSGIN